MEREGGRLVLLFLVHAHHSTSQPLANLSRGAFLVLRFPSLLNFVVFSLSMPPVRGREGAPDLQREQERLFQA